MSTTHGCVRCTCFVCDHHRYANSAQTLNVSGSHLHEPAHAKTCERNMNNCIPVFMMLAANAAAAIAAVSAAQLLRLPSGRKISLFVSLIEQLHYGIVP